jgi:FkbM family methyltransferase
MAVPVGHREAEVKTTRVQIQGPKHDEFVTVRSDTWDRNIVTDVLAGDEYGLKELAVEHPEFDFVVDIGAHIGGFALAALQLWPKASLIVCEPDLENVALLTQNLAPYVAEGREVYTVAMAVRGEKGSGETPFLPYRARAPYNTGSGGVVDHADLRVQVMPIANLIGGAPDLVKIDTEGLEVEILQSVFDQKKQGLLGFVVGEYHGFENRSRLYNITAQMQSHGLVTDSPGSGKDCGNFMMVPIQWPCPGHRRLTGR